MVKNIHIIYFTPSNKRCMFSLSKTTQPNKYSVHIFGVQQNWTILQNSTQSYSEKQELIILSGHLQTKFCGLDFGSWYWINNMVDIN